MDKLKERHSFIKTDIYGEQHSNITKEVACGFAEWIESEDSIGNIKPSVIGGKWLIVEYGDIKKRLTTSELFDIYIKSL